MLAFSCFKGSSKAGKSSDGALVAAIVIGVLFFFIVIVLIVYFVCRARYDLHSFII
jgi:heme/copper-type cytochrome/quinol oxidase subunit 2